MVIPFGAPIRFGDLSTPCHAADEQLGANRVIFQSAAGELVAQRQLHVNVLSHPFSCTTGHRSNHEKEHHSQASLLDPFGEEAQKSTSIFIRTYQRPGLLKEPAIYLTTKHYQYIAFHRTTLKIQEEARNGLNRAINRLAAWSHSTPSAEKDSQDAQILHPCRLKADVDLALEPPSLTGRVDFSPISVTWVEKRTTGLVCESLASRPVSGGSFMSA